MTTTICSNPGCEKPAVIKFCSSSCAAKYNNTQRPKKSNPCEICGEEIGRLYRKSHKSCKSNYYLTRTLGELRSKAVRDAQVYNNLRQMSRKIAKQMNLTFCELCGYDKHFEVCHLNPLSSLPDSCTVAEAVEHTNFRVLCPNHHWELDHDLL